MSAKHREVMTIHELAEYLRIPKSTLYKLVREGTLPCQKIGKHWRFHKSAIDDWLAHESQLNGAVKKHARGKND